MTERLTPDETATVAALSAEFDWRDSRYVLRVARCVIAALVRKPNSGREHQH